MTHSTTAHDTPAGKTLAEHRALHALLGEVERAAADPEAREALASRLGTLRERLDAHFTAEEESGLFEQIRDLAPEQAHECSRLCDEHTALLGRLDALRSADAGERGDAWTRGVKVFLDALSGHEARENEILTRVLDGSEQAQD
jgi:iron-sulfur cluster repair protein YtfE (RIC family)